jgi:predicted DNA-binding transcriptional regulator AlpA
MENEKNSQLIELASSYPGLGLIVIVKCSDLIDAIRFMAKEDMFQKEQKNSDKIAETYLTEDEVRQMLNVSHSTLWRWKKEEYLIPVKVGRKNRYKKSEIEALINQKN